MLKDQDLGHSNISVTDRVYGVSAKNDVQDQIENLGEKDVDDYLSDKEIERIAEQVAKKLKLKS